MEEKNKIIIYQVFTRLFGNRNKDCKPNGTILENGCGKMNNIGKTALREIKALGVTHIWYTGIIAHATKTDWTAYGIPKNHPSMIKGNAGSPYAIRDYYDVDPELAMYPRRRMAEFEALVARTHEAGLKVIIDFVPNHVARQYCSTAKPEGVRDLGEDDDLTKAFDVNNNFYYIPNQHLRGEIDLYDPEQGTYDEMPAKATGNNRFDPWPEKNDWYETVKLNYGVDFIHNTGCHFTPTPSTWQKMLDIVLFWASKGVDGFRCDMAEMVPCEFWGWMIPQVKEQYPHINFIAEVYNPHEYRNYINNGRFDYLYDKVGLYDTLRAIVCGWRSATDITGCWQSVDDIQGHMLNFLENHDEQRIASDFFAGDARKALPALVVSACMNTSPMMIYFGQELGERGMDAEGFSGRDGRTTIFDYWSVDTVRRWANSGRWNGAQLTAEEKALRKCYRTLLNLCNSEPAIARGLFFDLMYANTENWHIDKHRQFAFLRKYADDLLLIVVNFNEATAEVGVNIPQHAFDFLGIPVEKGEVTATDLLTGKEESITLSPTSPVLTDIPGWGAKLLKVTLKQ